jgi:Ricin-type beta-trefoil lectin domain
MYRKPKRQAGRGAMITSSASSEFRTRWVAQDEISRAKSSPSNLDTPSVVKARHRGAGPIRGIAGKCIDDANAAAANGNAIQIFACNGTNAQSWTWNSGDGTLRVLGKCMDVTNGATVNDTLVQLFDCNGTDAQEWRWRNQSSMVNPQSGRCLDVPNGNTADGTQLDIYDCNGTAAQAWYLP